MPLFQHALVILAVLFLDLAVGGIRVARIVPAGPPVLVARLALNLSRRLDRPSREQGTLRVLGGLH